MSKASQQHIADNEAIVASTTASPEVIAMAKANVDLWLSIEGHPGKYGTEYAAPAASPVPLTPAAPAAPAQQLSSAHARAQVPSAGDEEAVPASFEGRIAVGKATTDDVEAMSLKQFSAYVAKFPPEVPLEWQTDPGDREPDDRTDEQVAADFASQRDAIIAERNEAEEWGSGLYDRMDATRAQRAALAKAEVTRDATILSIRQANPHLSESDAAKYAPSIETLLGIARTNPKQLSGVAQAQADLAKFSRADLGLPDGEHA